MNFSENINKSFLNKINHDFYITDNIYLLKHLKRLGKKYHVIYIDPPYNTQTNDKIYNDNSTKESWGTEIKKRLEIIPELLEDNGFIAINIGIDEFIELGMICDKIFGRKNRISILLRKTVSSGQPARLISNNVDFIYIYAKKRKKLIIRKDKKKREILKQITNKWRNLEQKSYAYNVKRDYEINFKNKKYYANSISIKEWKKRKRQTQNGIKEYSWEFNKNKYLDYKRKGKIRLNKKTIKIQYMIKKKKDDIIMPVNCWLTNEIFFNSGATTELKKLFPGKNQFDFPKPVGLIEWIINLHPNKNSNILDFYGGSGTTIHSTMQLNKKDNGKRKATICILEENQINIMALQRLKIIIKGSKNKNTKWENENKLYKNNGIRVFEESRIN